MYLEILTPEKTIYGEDIHLVQLPALDGYFEILHNHAPLISRIAKGRIKIENKAKEYIYFDTDGGAIEVLNNKATLLTESISQCH